MHYRYELTSPQSSVVWQLGWTFTPNLDTPNVTEDGESDILRENLENYRLPVRGWLFASCITVRTNNWKNFKSDFFCPLYHRIQKTDALAKNTLAKLGALLWDFLTLGIRLVTLAPRIYFQSQRKNGYLIAYLEGASVGLGMASNDERYRKLDLLAKCDTVRIRCIKDKTKLLLDETVNLVEIPG